MTAWDEVFGDEDPNDPEILAVNAVELPAWFPAPPVLPSRTIRAVEIEGEWKVVIDELPGEVWDTPVEAYDSVKERDIDITLDKSLNRDEWGHFIGSGMFFANKATPDATSVRGLIGRTQADHLWLDKSRYSYYLRDTDEYRADPENWVKAYNWLEAHPMFWINTDPTYYLGWQKENGLSDLWTSVGTHANGEPYVMLEGGPHTDDFSQRSLDHRLDAVGATFEEAYIKFAKNVDKYYDKSGEERHFEGDDHETMGLPPELIERLNEYKERESNE
jgi:hypothetical protein